MNTKAFSYFLRMRTKIFIGVGVCIVVMGGLFVVFQKPKMIPEQKTNISFSDVSVTEQQSDDMQNVQTSSAGNEVTTGTILQEIKGQGQQKQTDVQPPPSSVTPLLPREERTADPVVQQSSQIFINGRMLSEQEVQALLVQYGGTPEPGSYWYDMYTGLYGYIGGPATGVIAPGHAFGTMARNASNGYSGVVVNGRELTSGEVSMLAQVLGTVIPGFYWLDASGNYGVEGNSMVLGNLYAYGGGGNANTSGGDNFWSSGNYSGGNYNANNTEGYVSVPGYGPVSYGF